MHGFGAFTKSKLIRVCHLSDSSAENFFNNIKEKMVQWVSLSDT